MTFVKEDKFMEKTQEENIKQEENKKQKKHHIDPWMITSVVLFVLIIGSIFTDGFGIKNLLKSPDKIAQKTLEFINQNMLAEGYTASLVESRYLNNGLYEVKFQVEDQEFDSYVSGDGKMLFLQGINMEEVTAENEDQSNETTVVGDFIETEDEICTEDGKPIVYFFGSNSCPHCQWEEPVLKEVVSKFGDKIVFHKNIDSSDDQEIFDKYSTGGVPTIVLGCKYYRVGSGENDTKEVESQALTDLICDLTEDQPSDVCQVKAEQE